MHIPELSTVLDLLDIPVPVQRVPEMPDELNMPGLRVFSLPAGLCSLRYKSDWHLINVELNSWQPFRINCDSDHNQDIKAPLGGMMVLPAGTELRLSGANRRSDFVMEVDPSRFDELLGERANLQLQLWTSVAGAHTMAQQAVVALESSTPNRLLIEGLALAICGLASDISRDTGPSEGRNLTAFDPRMKRAIDYIEANLEADVSIATLAAVACLSPHHFARAFRETFGEPPHSYVQRRRIARAQNLLQETRTPIAELALDCGFSSQAHFTTVFRQATGATPAAFRREKTRLHA